MAADRRRILTVVVATVALSSMAGVARAAPVAPVALGDYEAAPVVEDGGTYATGLFSVVKDAGRRTIVPTAGFDAIFYPDTGECDELSLPLLAPSVAITPTGRFRIQEKTPVGNDSVLVDWKGHWTKAKRVTGSITIKFDGCTSKERWIGHRSG